jgi:hypothetical protein
LKTQLTAFALLSGLLLAAPSCSNDSDEGSNTGDGDSSGDGDGDGATEYVPIDNDGDDVPDGVDTNGDGVIDRAGTAVDPNNDGVYDGLDTDGDGNPNIPFTWNPSGDGDGDGDGDSCTDSSAPRPVNPDGTTDVGEDFEACAAEAREAEALPADIIFMIDQSISMIEHTVPEGVEGAPTRWELLREAVLEFFRSEESAGLRIGLQFFPQQGDWQFPDGGGNSGVSCEAGDYSELAVEVAALPGNADALEEAYPEQPEGGFTPSHASLEGALSHAREWADMPENAGRGVAVVWVTDGYPTVCDDQTISGLSDLAASYNNPEDGETRIPTFVVGLGPTPNLNVVARAGGTGEGFFVADEECDAVETLLESLRRVANTPNLCEFNMPRTSDGTAIDLDKVNMQFTPFGGTPSAIGRTDGPASCAETGGWYYDNPEEPEKILVCPQSCGNFGGGTVSIVAGCETISVF